jgi:zinc-ribbon domain
MYCSNCGSQLPDEARFCKECGASAAGKGQAVPPPPTGGGRSGSRGIWIALAAIGIVVIALAIALPLVLLRGNDTTTIETISASSTTVTTTPPTSEQTMVSTEATTETTAAPSSTTTGAATAGIPGDSAGSWTETNISGLDQNVNEVAVSNDALLFQTSEGPAENGNRIFAYVFASKQTIQLPTDALHADSVDVDGLLAVWREATYDSVQAVTDAHIFAYLLPDGPKIEVASGVAVSYPQVSGSMITWIEGKPWSTAPDEYWDMAIKGAAVDEHGQPTGAAGTLVESAIAAVAGDATWTYSLSDSYLAWEQASSAGALDAGSYMMDLGEMQPHLIDSEAWRPSLTGHMVAFSRNGIEVSEFGSGRTQQIDPVGDFPTAAPTYVAYFRPTPAGDGTTWAVVARGLTGSHEQVLLDDAGVPPWFLTPIATSANRIAFVIDGKLHLFGWQGS